MLGTHFAPCAHALPGISFVTILQMLKSIELSGFKSFGRKTELIFTSKISAVVGPNGSGKSNVAEGFRFVLGEQSMKSMRSKRGEDLIWGGGPGLQRANRASVSVTFDNRKKVIDLDFPEVVIERIVYRDGQNEYLINGSKVRLKDVVQLLAGANIGASGYHIISQGEADRILNASARERREMVEEALGLKVYQYKKVESERKLEETQGNIEKVQSLRREISPHLKFLRKQVEKIEKARDLKNELISRLSEYLAREDAYIKQETARLKDEKGAIREERGNIERSLVQAKQALGAHGSSDETKEQQVLMGMERELTQAREASREVMRALGRAEGELAAAEARAEQVGDAAPAVSAAEARVFAEEIQGSVDAALSLEDIGALKDSLASLKKRVTEFLQKYESGAPAKTDEVRALREKVEQFTKELNEANKTIETQEAALLVQRKKLEQEREEAHIAERELVRLEGQEREHAARERTLAHAEGDLASRRTQFEEEVREGIVLLGKDVHAWESEDVPEGALGEDRSEQEKRRRDVERLKIKIEEYAGGNSDEVLKEFNQTRERDEFLARELEDLGHSAESLRQIIEELDAKIDERFREGLGKINEALQTFFAELFGGGDARLVLEKPRVKESDSGEEQEMVAGLEIKVQLPRKRVAGLDVLSGGERALTSIALIFAMSQVHPPPFLILDETDAALDEANSKRYADMVKKLAERSQLILITHNRATMHSAGELYGVTMAQDGVSKLLSVKIEEAEQVAK